ncbi:MAG: ABC transporter ATP-binding protein [Leptospira sp.]|nr:ABC transporter ATP-binding protein [Leptospira sp.]
MISKVENLNTTRLLECKNLFKKFANEPVLNGINFCLEGPSLLALVGPNGAGKTTLLRILAGLVTQDSGSVQFDGYVNSLASDRVGYCPQTPVFWKYLTVYEQFLFLADLYKIPRKAITERIEFLIDALRLESVVKKRVEHLSGGMQKRVNLAGSLVHSPSLLLLDEPTANLDMEAKAYVHNLLKELILKNQILIVCSSHDLMEISQSATHLLIIRDGSQKYFSNMDDLSSIPGNELKIQDLYSRFASNPTE